ncbi:MAG: CoA transferase [Chloroflexi bacterium]|nr:CoA transferase [Chloroflexota bacterium]
MSDTPPTGPLAGVRVLELGSLIAGPFAGRILADFGADVLKIEPPESGDPLRTWSFVTEHGSLWSLAQSRNKRSVSVDLRTAEGREIVRGLARECQVVIENFRPGRMETWGLGYDDLASVNPALVMVRISGFGQTGPYSHRPGFGNIAESMGGIRYITGWPDRPPLRIGLSIGDSIAGLYAVVGTLMALRVAEQTGRGQVVDVALMESVFSMLEAIVPEYGYDGRVRERTGNLLGGSAPSNTYPTADGHWLAIGANGDGIFRRFSAAIGQPELAHDPCYATNQARRANAGNLDALIAEWTSTRTLAEAMAILNEADVPAGPVYSVEDIANDPQYQAREMLVDLPDARLGRLLMPGIVPRLTATPGAIRSAGPDVGQDTDDVLGRLLGLDPKALAALRDRRVI